MVNYITSCIIRGSYETDTEPLDALFMKSSLWLLALLSLFMMTCRQDQDEPATVAYLPLTIKEGYGSFHLGFGRMSDCDTTDGLWGKTHLPVTGTPKHWSSLSRKRVWLNSKQLAYQNFLANRITPENYAFLQKEWRWSPDTTKLSARPIKCYVHIINGFDEQRNKWVSMVDTDNDLDFSDETPLYPEVIKPGQIPDQLKDIRQVRYETYQKGEIKEANVPLVIRRINGEFVYNIPQYAVATLRRNNKEYELLISSGFRRPDFEIADIASASSLSGKEKIDPSDIIEVGGLIELGGVQYRNNGVDSFNNWLELEPVGKNVKAYSTQIGHPLYPFAANEFTSGKRVSLDQYKGKYVYVDFWETGCQPCVEDMPALKQLYQRIDKKRIDFVGIVNDSPVRVSRFLKKHRLEWPQIRSDSVNKLIETYHITGYPTSVLIDPAGTVIARDLRSEGLSKKISELTPVH